MRLVDPTGEASIESWVLNPIGTAFFTGSLGSTALAAKLSGRPATAQLILHSLSINPGNINAGNGSALANSINSSGLYQNSVQQLLREATATGQTSVSNAQLPLRFTEGDAATAFGKIDVYVNATRDSNGAWQVSTRGSDRYDFAYQNYNRPAFSTVNNTAYFGQATGAVSNFTTNVSFTHSIPLSQQTFTTPSGAVVNWGGELISGPPKKE